MAFEHYIRSGQKWLRCGYTTGTCAALAAAGAARLLLTGEAAAHMSLKTPKGLTVDVPLTELKLTGDTASCAVIKDGGDDADVTDGYPIAVSVRRLPSGLVIDGGEGVGRVTKPGLDQPVGAAAINRVPREMIRAAAEREMEAAGYTGGLSVTVSVPDGAKLAAHTFNPVLGVEGGISILGTSGIVEPMSDQAIVDTIALEARQARASGAAHMILTPGNYGMDFLTANGLNVPGVPCVKYSNFVGEALDIAVSEGFTSVLLVGHIGKLVKVAGGVMNTHSKYADCRLELLCAHAALCGGSRELCQGLMTAATTDAAIPMLDGEGLRQPVMDSLMTAIQRYLERRVRGGCRVGALMFSNEYGLLGRTHTVEELMQLWQTS